MNINPNFINTVLDNFYNALHEDQDGWCRIAHFDADNNYYADATYQKVYALRYLPAYYFEFCYLASWLNSRIDGYRHLNIASLGCGLSPDYYALKDNLEIDFRYSGFDVANWSVRNLMPELDEDFQIFESGAGGLTQDQANEFDVYIFPKSIRDIYGSDPLSLENLANLVGQSNKRRIFFINSFVSDNNVKSNDLEFFIKVHNILIQHGFTCQDNIRDTYNVHDKVIGLRGIDNNFLYPDNRIVVCRNRGQNQLCNFCIVVKKPILKNKFISFQILEYLR
jgi:hypothetical protein